MDKKKKNKKYFLNNNSGNRRNEELCKGLQGVFITTDKSTEKTCVRDSYNILNSALEELYPDLEKLLEVKRIKEEEEQLKLKLEKELLEKVNCDKDNCDNKEEITDNKEEDNKDDEGNNLESNEEKDQFEKANKMQKISDTEKKSTSIENVEKKHNKNNKNSLENNLENELDQLRKSKKHFFQFDTNTNGIIFIKLDNDIKDIVCITTIVKYIVNKLKTTQQPVSKFIPIELACRAKLDIFKVMAPQVLDKYFKKSSEGNNEKDIKMKSWRCDFKARNNNSIIKMDFIKVLTDTIDKNYYHVNYKTPDVIILIEICNDLLCLSVLDDYLENKLYNLFTLIEQNKNKTITNKDENDVFNNDKLGHMGIENKNESFLNQKNLNKLLTAKNKVEEEKENNKNQEESTQDVVEKQNDNENVDEQSDNNEEIDII